MSLAKALTPDNTEELKPGLFIQQRGKGYRQVEPIAWGGKIRWKEQLSSVFSFRTAITLAIIIFIVWSYLNDVGEYKQFHDDVMSNPAGWCNNLKQESAGQLEVLNVNLDSYNISCPS